MTFSLANYNSGLRYKTLTTRAWAVTGNTDTVTDANVHPNSIIEIQNLSQFVGPWWVTVTQGQFVVNSANSETATTTTYTYIIL